MTQSVKVLTDAFQHDPLWTKILEGASQPEKKFQAFFEAGIRHCFKYGEVYAPSDALEGIIAWVPGEYAEINLWHTICSGAIGAMMRTGLSLGKKLLRIFKPIDEDRRLHMAGNPYIYVMMVGVAPELQGKGFGREIIGAAIEKSDREGVQLYLETHTEENVKMYEHFGFDLLKRIILPVVDHPMWEMVKRPEK